MHYGKNTHRRSQATSQAQPSAIIEPLEDRRLLSGSFFGHGGFGFGGGRGGGGFGRGLTSIEFSQAPSKVQTGLDSLDKLTAPTATQTVYLGNQNGVETYTIDITGTGTQTALTVDQNGDPVTAPTNGTTTYAAVPAAVSTEAAAIAGALSLTVPAPTASVRVNTPNGGTSVYTLELVASTTTTSTSSHVHGRTFQINASGDPVGSLNLPFDALPGALQDALNNNRPTGATALLTTSTQSVKIRTSSGVTTYTTSFTVGTTTTPVTVDAAGALTKLPSHSTTTFSALSTAVQAAINALATDNGATGTIAATTTVQVYNEANGTTIYSVNVNGNKIGLSGKSFTYNLTISVDQDGNPTTLPGGGDEFGGSFGGFGGGPFFGGFGFFGRRHR